MTPKLAPYFPFPIADSKGMATAQFQNYWQQAIEQAVAAALSAAAAQTTADGAQTSAQAAQIAANGAQTTATAAGATATAAQTAATTAGATAAAAQTTANSKLDQATADTLYVKDSVGPSFAAASGTADRTTFATYAAPTISNPPTQTEVQNIANATQAASQHLKAVIDDLRANKALTS